MKLELRKKIGKVLPSNYKLKEKLIPISYPIEFVPLSVYPPDSDLIMYAKKDGLFGLFRGWEPVGQILHDDENAIYIWERHKKTHGQLIEAMVTSMIPGVKVIYKKSSFKYKPDSTKS